jgi:A/G-specific adenine glycosylase
LTGKRKVRRIASFDNLTRHDVQADCSFRRIIYTHYRKYPRSLPWRKTRDPYKILVSEVMLQQTQVERVLKKYRLFVKTFPDFSSLAEASLKDILTVWKGMGYNRRTIFLKNIAKTIVTKFGGELPSSEEALIKLPGIGRYTAAAILTFAYNRPLVIIETNIRTVYIHFFFQEKNKVKDTEIIPLIEKTLDRKNPCEWYYALMDYGVMLKKEHKNLSRKSAHYQRQTPFHGSNRQVRGMILKLLVEKPGLSQKEIIMKLDLRPEKIQRNLKELQDEGFLKSMRRKYTIT